MEVVEVDPAGPAAAAQVSPGDLIVAVGDRVVGGVDDLHGLLGDWTIGASTKLTVLRGASLLEIDVVPAEASRRD